MCHTSYKRLSMSHKLLKVVNLLFLVLNSRASWSIVCLCICTKFIIFLYCYIPGSKEQQFGNCIYFQDLQMHIVCLAIHIVCLAILNLRLHLYFVFFVPSSQLMHIYLVNFCKFLNYHSDMYVCMCTFKLTNAYTFFIWNTGSNSKIFKVPV